jgi:hypothetical protein
MPCSCTSTTQPTSPFFKFFDGMDFNSTTLSSFDMLFASFIFSHRTLLTAKNGPLWNITKLLIPGPFYSPFQSLYPFDNECRIHHRTAFELHFRGASQVSVSSTIPNHERLYQELNERLLLYVCQQDDSCSGNNPQFFQFLWLLYSRRVDSRFSSCRVICPTIQI